MLSSQVKRFVGLDTYFGRHDRLVPVVLHDHPTALHTNGEDQNLRMYAIPVEEYIAEQLEYHVVDDLIVLDDNKDLVYDSQVGLVIPDHYDREVNRPNDDAPAFSAEGYDAWCRGADDSQLTAYRVRCDAAVVRSDVNHLRQCNATTVISQTTFIMVEWDDKRTKVTNTNYWSSPEAYQGMCVLVANKDRLQLLLPPAQEHSLKEMKKAKRVIAFNGIFPPSGTYGWFIVFDDFSRNPLAILTQFTLLDRCSSWTRVTFAVQTQQGVVHNFPCEIKAVPTIPPLRW